VNRARGSLSALLAAIVLLSACGGANPEGPATFVSIGDSAAATLSWTDDGSGHLVGALQNATANSTGTGDLVNSVNVSFTGTLNGGQISIVTSGVLGSTSTWTGSLAGDTLTLNMAQDNSSIAPVTFARGKLSVYNSAVSKLQDQVTQERTKAASDAASASAKAASDQASAANDAALANADEKVSAALVTLQGSLSAGLSFDQFTTDMTTLKQDLATTLADSAKAVAGGRSNVDACGDSSTAQGDASSVDGDASSIEGDASTAHATIDSVANQAEDLRTAFAQVKTTYQQQGLTISTSEGAPVLKILNQSDAAVKTWKPKVASYVATAHQLAAQAISTADAAARAVC
jgi:hypothetical protein